MIRVLLAVGTENLSALLRGILTNAEQEEFDVLYEEVYNRNFIISHIESKRPDILVVHDTFLASHMDSAAERDKEMLQILKTLRVKELEVRVVYICERDEKDAFLGKLVALGVYDIFHQQRFSSSVFVAQLSDKPRFNNVSKFTLQSVDVDFDKPVVPGETAQIASLSMHGLDVDAVQEEESKSMFSSIYGRLRTSKEKSDEAASESIEVAPVEKDVLKEEKGRLFGTLRQKFSREKSEKTSVVPPAVVMETVEKPIEKPSHVPSVEPQAAQSDNQEVESVVQPQAAPIYIEPQRGAHAMVIACAGLTENIGTTTLAVHLAQSYVSMKQRVCILELNQSLGFERLHSYVEQSFTTIHDAETFEYRKIDFIKFQYGMQVTDYLKKYDVVILDIGVLTDRHPYLSEFKRAAKRFVCTPAAQWKWHTVDRLNAQDAYALEDYTFLLSGGKEDDVTQFKQMYGKDIRIVPYTLSNTFDFSLSNEQDYELIKSLTQQPLTIQTNSGSLYNNKLFISAGFLILIAVFFYF